MFFPSLPQHSNQQRRVQGTHPTLEDPSGHLQQHLDSAAAQALPTTLRVLWLWITQEHELLRAEQHTGLQHNHCGTGTGWLLLEHKKYPASPDKTFLWHDYLCRTITELRFGFLVPQKQLIMDQFYFMLVMYIRVQIQKICLQISKLICRSKGFAFAIKNLDRSDR